MRRLSLLTLVFGFVARRRARSPGDAAADAAVHPGPRRALHGPQRRSLRRLLRLLLRRLAEAQSHPGRPDELERLREAGRGDPAATSGACSRPRRTRRATRTPVQVQIGDYFAACMDEARVEALGAKPLQPALDSPRRGEGQGRPGPVDGRATPGHIGRASFSSASARSRTPPTPRSSSPPSTPVASVCPIATTTWTRTPSRRSSGPATSQHVEKMLVLLGDDAATAKSHRQAGDGHRDRPWPRRASPGWSGVTRTRSSTGCRWRSCTSSPQPSTGRPTSARSASPGDEGAQREPAEVPPGR